MFFAVAIVIILSILILGLYTVFTFVGSIFVLTSAGALLTFHILMFALPFCFVGAMVWSSFFNNWASRLFYRLNVIWLSFFFYFLLAAGVYAVVAFVWPSALFGQTLFGLAFLVTIFGFVHATSTKIKNVSVSLPNLPTVWKGKKIIFLSDLHLGQIRGASFAKKVVEMINAENPELVLIGGDIYDGVKVDPDAVIAPFADLKSKHGTFFVMGNHEEFRDNSAYKKALADRGITVIEDTFINLEGLQLVGVDYHTTETKEGFQKVLDGISLDSVLPSILLKHVPSHLDIAEKKGISLSLSGHTHKAQAWPLSIFTYFIFKGYDYGLKKLHNMSVYTSSGVGTWGPPIRVGSDSEIIVINFN